MASEHSTSERGNPLPPLDELAAWEHLYALSHRQDNTHHSLYYSSRKTQTGTKNCSMGPP